MKINRIDGPEPHREGEYGWSYLIGCDGVTSIEEQTENLGSYGITWFIVKRGEDAIAKMNALHVAHVGFMPTEGGAA